jgi:hypothetical protein
MGIDCCRSSWRCFYWRTCSRRKCDCSRRYNRCRKINRANWFSSNWRGSWRWSFKSYKLCFNWRRNICQGSWKSCAPRRSWRSCWRWIRSSSWLNCDRRDSIIIQDIDWGCSRKWHKCFNYPISKGD